MKRVPLILTILLVLLLFAGASALAQGPGDAPADGPEENISELHALSRYYTATDTAGSQVRFVDGVYIVTLVDPPLSSYRGGIRSLEPTNPATRGERKLDTQSEAFEAYRSYLAERQQAVLDRAEQLLAIQSM